MGESENLEKDSDLESEMIVLTDRIIAIKNLSKIPVFLGDMENKRFVSEKNSLAIISNDLKRIKDLIKDNHKNINLPFKKFLINNIKNFNFICSKLNKDIKKYSSTSLLEIPQDIIKNEDLIEIQENINCLIYKTSDIETKIQNFLEVKNILESYKSELLELANIDLANIFKNTMTRYKNDLNNLGQGVEHSNKTMSEIDIQLKNNINAVRTNHNNALKLTTTIQNLENSLLDEFKKVREETEIFYKSEISSLVKEASDTKSEVTERIRAELYMYMAEQDNEKQRLAQTIDDTKKNHKDFITLVEKAGVYELTQNYSKKADDEKQEYKDYRKYTTWAILAAIAATLVIFALPIIESWIIEEAVQMDYFTLFARLTISIMFFALAFYTSKQAGKHYECYQENHRTYLQLAALEPFISRMNDDDKLAIRKELISVYFNKTDDGKFAAKGDEVDSSIIHRMLDIIKDLKQPAKSEES